MRLRTSEQEWHVNKFADGFLLQFDEKVLIPMLVCTSVHDKREEGKMWEKTKRREEQPGREKVQQAPRMHDVGSVNCGCCHHLYDD